MRPETSLSCSKEPTIDSHPEQNWSILHTSILFRFIIVLPITLCLQFRFTNQTLYIPIFYMSMRATSTSLLSLLFKIILKFYEAHHKVQPLIQGDSKLFWNKTACGIWKWTQKVLFDNTITFWVALSYSLTQFYFRFENYRSRKPRQQFRINLYISFIPWILKA
jgi:hypothetical protein